MQRCHHSPFHTLSKTRLQRLLSKGWGASVCDGTVPHCSSQFILTENQERKNTSQHFFSFLLFPICIGQATQMLKLMQNYKGKVCSQDNQPFFLGPEKVPLSFYFAAFPDIMPAALFILMCLLQVRFCLQPYSTRRKPGSLDAESFSVPESFR